MTGLGSRLVEQGFGCPSGWLGRLGGALMAHGNAANERHVASLAELSEHDVVLVVGPGPGIGVDAAAAHAGHVIALDPSPLMLAARELRQVLRPEGRPLLSTHQKWLPGELDALATTVSESGYTRVRTWTWKPPGRGATTAAQLSARRAPFRAPSPQ